MKTQTHKESKNIPLDDPNHPDRVEARSLFKNAIDDDHQKMLEELFTGLIRFH